MNDYKELVDALRCGAWSVYKVNSPAAMCETIYNVQIADAIEQLVKERDAAVKDMQDYQGSFCCYCKRNNTEECIFPDEVLLMCGKFEWRGVQK
ncbi:MAG: hypothetical protein MJ230_07235 [bacterium]|nr:hypothetical protein [bacterium]